VTRERGYANCVGGLSRRGDDFKKEKRFGLREGQGWGEKEVSAEGEGSGRILLSPSTYCLRMQKNGGFIRDGRGEEEESPGAGSTCK